MWKCAKLCVSFSYLCIWKTRKNNYHMQVIKECKVLLFHLPRVRTRPHQGDSPGTMVTTEKETSREKQYQLVPQYASQTLFSLKSKGKEKEILWLYSQEQRLKIQGCQVCNNQHTYFNGISVLDSNGIWSEPNCQYELHLVRNRGILYLGKSLPVSRISLKSFMGPNPGWEMTNKG